ncbi:MAG: DUF488 domain-containing protein [Anaerolineales bacterium]
MRTIYTIGHSNHSVEDFIALLEDKGITLLVDVRLSPYSRYCPQFNKETLAHALRAHDIEYAHAGQYLGGRPRDATCYKKRAIPPEGADYLHEVDYQEVMKREWFRQGIQRLLELAEEHVAAVMCSEEDPRQCHRHYLIAVYLKHNHPEVEVIHIRGDGNEFRARDLPDEVPEVTQAEQLSLF